MSYIPLSELLTGMIILIEIVVVMAVDIDFIFLFHNSESLKIIWY